MARRGGSGRNERETPRARGCADNSWGSVKVSRRTGRWPRRGWVVGGGDDGGGWAPPASAGTAADGSSGRRLSTIVKCLACGAYIREVPCLRDVTRIIVVIVSTCQNTHKVHHLLETRTRGSCIGRGQSIHSLPHVRVADATVRLTLASQRRPTRAAHPPPSRPPVQREVFFLHGTEAAALSRSPPPLRCAVLTEIHHQAASPI